MITEYLILDIDVFNWGKNNMLKFVYIILTIIYQIWARNIYR